MPRRSLALATLMSISLCGLAGCNIVGPVGFLVAGDDKIPAQFELPKDRTAVVFIDDRASLLPSRAARQSVAKAAERSLLDNGAVPKADIISSDSILPVALGERFGKPMSIADVGRAVKADVVIYATIDSFSLSSDGSTFAPTAVARIKVIDSKTDKRLWPESPQEWSVVEAVLPSRQGSTPTRASDRSQAQQDLAERLGTLLGYVFVKHAPRELDRRVGS